MLARLPLSSSSGGAGAKLREDPRIHAVTLMKATVVQDLPAEWKITLKPE
jgi:hypothetical protein